MEIQQILQTCAEAYLRKVYEFCNQPNSHFSLTLKNTSGPIKKLLNEARIKSHATHLEGLTVIEDYERHFIRSKTMKDVDDDTRAELMKVCFNYNK